MTHYTNYRIFIGSSVFILALMLCFSQIAHAQNNTDASITVSGTVTDQKGEPLPGTSIVVKDVLRGTSADRDGNYSLEVSPSDTLEFRYVGFKTQTVPVEGRGEINVRMEPESSSMEEIQVLSTGYQKIDRERATGSFSTISSDELEKVPTNNIIDRLEGRVAGLQVDINSSDNTFVYSNLLGEGGGQTRNDLAIRGQSTFQAENSPLLVVDGVPTELDLRTLNPNDVKNVTFLKDAAAASIYGARAANGVIVVETKSGKPGSTSISYSNNIMFSSTPSVSSLNLMNSAQVLDLERELIDRGFVTDPRDAFGLFFSQSISDGMEIMFQEQRGNITQQEREAALDQLRGRNNYGQIEEYLLQPASSMNHNLSFSGGREDYSFYTSLAYAKEQTNSVGTGADRVTATINQDFTIVDFFDVSTSLKGAFFDFNQNGLGANLLNPTQNTYLPYNRLVGPNGNSQEFYQQFYRDDIERLESEGYLPWTYNYIQELNNADNNTQEQNYSANIEVQFPIIGGLEVSSRFFTERTYLTNENFNNINRYSTRNQINNATYQDPETGELQRGLPVGGIMNVTEYTNSSYTARQQLNYNSTIDEDHVISAIGGIELRQTRTQESGRDLYGYNDESQTSVDLISLQYLNVFGSQRTLDLENAYIDQRRRFLSYFTNASYTYDSRYTITGSARLDDYNNFGVDKEDRRAPLWSTGVKWNLSNESFMEDVDFFDNLSLRASYGFNGNVSLSAFPFTNISLVDSDRFSQDPYASISNAANPNLRWEKTRVINVGVDFTILDARLNGTVEYYRKDSDNLIQDFEVSPFFGLPNDRLVRNVASLEGRGVDLNLNGLVVQKDDLNVRSSFILSYNTNNVDETRFDDYSAYLNGRGNSPPVLGYGLNSIFAFRNAGLNENGATLIRDREGNIVGPTEQLQDIEDMRYMGRAEPQYFGSLSSTLNYKGLSLYVLATYKMDYVLFKPTFGDYIGIRGNFNSYDLFDDVAQRWQEPGDEANTIVPGLANGFNGFSAARYRFGDQNVIAGDHIRLREVSLSYNFSSLLQNFLLKGGDISLTARNLGLIWRKNNEGIDPDFLPSLVGQVNFAPQTMYSVGVNINL